MKCFGNCFKIFIKKILSLPKKSLKLSIEVLKERENIEINILNLRYNLDDGLNLLESYKEQIKNIEKNKDIMNESKKFKIQITVPEIQREDLPPGTYTTTCLMCNRTCLEETNFPDEKKRYCPNFDKNY